MSNVEVTLSAALEGVLIAESQEYRDAIKSQGKSELLESARTFTKDLPPKPLIDEDRSYENYLMI